MTNNLMLPVQPISADVFAEKYAKGAETTHHELFRRVAKGIAAAEAPEKRTFYEDLFFDNMVAGGIGAGRIMSAAGTDIEATLVNCFVQPVGDAIQGVDDAGYPGIYEALKMAAETMRRGGGVGYDFSRIRPKGACVKSTRSIASGPCSYMDVFDKSCETVESAGSRRGAQMGVLRIDHPDVLDFIVAKRTEGRWENFNVSLGVVDEFMLALESAAQWQLVHIAKPSEKLIEAGAFQRDDGMWVYRSMPAQEIWDIVMQSNYDFAEPGILFLTNINNDNNLRYVEIIEACNPCGEQPLDKYACCDLGPTDLARFIRNAFGIPNCKPTFDFESFGKVIRNQVRMLDNVLDITMWPLPEQQAQAQAKRRLGVGFSSLGNALTMLNLRYDSPAGRAMAAQITEFMRDEAYRASVELAIERGPFPLFDADKFLEEGTFASRLPDDIKESIRRHGIRNSHLLSIAPVGTISLAFFDNASNGIEPCFSYAYNRTKKMPDGSKCVYPCEDHAFRAYLSLALQHGLISDELADAMRSAAVNSNKTEFLRNALPNSFVTALEMTATDHLLMMQAVQPYIDAAISKTINVPADYPFDDFKNLYMSAWKFGLKGAATYRPNAILGSVLSLANSSPTETPKSPVKPDVDPLRITIEHRPGGSLPAVSEKIEYYTVAGKKSLYVIVSFAPVTGTVHGKDITIERPIEFFIPAGQEGDAQQWVTTTMRVLSLAARGGFVARALIDMRKVTWDRGPVRYGRRVKYDGTEVGMVHDSEVAAIAYALQTILFNRGFLDVDGNQVPIGVLAQKALTTQTETYPVAEQVEVEEAPEDVQPMIHLNGKKCNECGAHAVVRRDGCEICVSCNTIGHCG